MIHLIFNAGGGFKFDDDDGGLLLSETDADEGGAINPGMVVEDGFTGDGIHWPVAGQDDVGLASAEPEAPLGIEVAHVPHAVPKGITIGDFGEGGGFGAIEILASDRRASDNDFTNLAGG